MGNVLVVGKGAASAALAKKLKSCANVDEIFIAPGNGVNSEYYKNIDIREDDLTGLLKFALENEIELTVVASKAPLRADIAGFFNENGQNIFAPQKGACRDFLNKIYEKKFLYRIHAKCPKFAAFNRTQAVNEYLAQTKFPVVISSAIPSEIGTDSFVCTTLNIANKFLADLYSRGIADILIEDFCYGKNFTRYFITDGYSVIPFGSVYKEQADKDGYFSENGTCFSPNVYISEKLETELQNIAANIINTFEYKGFPYVGILGIDGVISENEELIICGIKPFLEDCDATIVLNLCDEDLYKIFMSCVNGYFSDEYEKINLKNLSAASLIVKAKISDDYKDLLDENDFIDFINQNKFILSNLAGTISRAKLNLQDNLAIFSDNHKS